MKKFAILMIFVVISMLSFAQIQKKKNEVVSTNSIQEETATYRLFPTQNMWTFIKLNTRNGQMWQVQYDIKGSNRSSTILSSVTLVSKEDEKNGRFTLYPTQNVYNFILLDQFDGRIWQAQWAMEIENRGIIPIE